LTKGPHTPKKTIYVLFVVSNRKKSASSVIDDIAQIIFLSLMNAICVRLKEEKIREIIGESL